MSRTDLIESFDLYPGRKLANKYEVIERLGGGWEGEVFRVRELNTDIERTAKFFYPQRNENHRTLKFYARKLHRLRNCPILIQYHTQDKIIYRRREIPFLISEYVEGMLLSEFIDRQPGKRLPAFTALHLLHALACGLECVHDMREYHGDLHTDNIIVQHFGLHFDLKLLDLFHLGNSSRTNMFEDVCDMIRIFYDVLGGPRHYKNQPDSIRQIICGLKRTLIVKKFRTAGELKHHLENMIID